MFDQPHFHVIACFDQPNSTLYISTNFGYGNSDSAATQSAAMQVIGAKSLKREQSQGFQARMNGEV